MRRGSPFHSRTSALCDSWEWRGWAGYLAASSYSLVPEMEYYAIRHSAGLLDVSPLYKYLIEVQDAGIGLDVTVTDVSEDIGALALQGPSSRAILLDGADGAVQKLRYFRFLQTKFDGIPVQISR